MGRASVEVPLARVAAMSTAPVPDPAEVVGMEVGCRKDGRDDGREVGRLSWDVAGLPPSPVPAPVLLALVPLPPPPWYRPPHPCTVTMPLIRANNGNNDNRMAHTSICALAFVSSFVRVLVH